MYPFLFSISNLMYAIYGMSFSKKLKSLSGLFICYMLISIAVAQAQTLPSGNYANFTPATGSTLYFTANDENGRSGLWKSDGTRAGTVFVKEVVPYGSLIHVNGSVYFATIFNITPGYYSYELWKSDGTPEGSVKFRDVPLLAPANDEVTGYNRAPVIIVGTDNLLYFTVNNTAETYELWRTDGTSQGTWQVDNQVAVAPDPGLYSTFGSAGNTLYYTSAAGLQKTTGTPQSTMLLNSTPFAEILTSTNGIVYFRDVANDLLWRSDGTVQGTAVIKKVEHLGQCIGIGNSLYYFIDDFYNFAQLWKTDGTANGTVLLKSFSSGGFLTELVKTNDGLVFSMENAAGSKKLWKSDGTPEGTKIIRDFTSLTPGPTAMKLTAIFNTLFFIVNDGVNGRELWISYGSTESTRLIKDITPGTASTTFWELINVNGTVFFTINGPQELWKTDGTEAGTVNVFDVNLSAPAFYKAEAVSRTQVRLYISGSNAANPQYILERATSANGNFTAIDTTLSDITYDATAQPNTTYYYRVKYISNNVSSPYSEVKSITTHPQVNSPINASKQWDKLISGQALAAISTSDGGYLVSTAHAGAYKLIKLNSEAQLLWEQTITVPIISIIATTDGGYMLGGNLTSNYYIAKLTATGTLVWSKTFGGTENDKLAKVIQTTDGGYLLAGTSRSGIGADKSEASRGEDDYWIIKLNTAGIKQWDKTFGGSENETFKSVALTTDGGYLLGGDSKSGISGDKSEPSLFEYIPYRGEEDFWVIKLTSSGNKQWDKTLGAEDAESLEAVLPTVDGGYLLAGSSRSFGDDTRGTCGEAEIGPHASVIYIVKIKNNGIQQWRKIISGGGNRYKRNDQTQEYLRSLIPTLDGGYLLAASSSSDGDGYGYYKTEGSRAKIEYIYDCRVEGTGVGPVFTYDYWMIKIDGDGIKQWDKTFGSFKEEYLTTAVLNIDGSFTLVGNTSSTTDNDGDKTQAGAGIWLVKTKGILPAPITCSATGSILREFWANVTGSTISAIPVNTSPTASAQLTSFETTPNQGDNYGERIRGYLCAPYSGTYTFYLAGDDQAELFLSSDEDPSKKTRIASIAYFTGVREWNKYPSQKSVAINLVAGRKYYIEALHKEGRYSDNLAVGWQTPALSAITVIPGGNLSPFVATCSSPTQSSYVTNASPLVGANLFLKTVPGATSYTLQVSTSPDFTTGVITKTTSSQLSTGTYYASFAELSLNQTYFVRVYTNLGLCWGPTTTFTTASAAASAYVTSPANGTVTTSTSLYLNTVPGASAYTVEVNTTADFTGQAITKTTSSRISTGTYYASFPELLRNQRYYVRVKTNLSEEWGRTTTFTTASAAASAYVTSPANGGTTTGTSLYLNTVPGAASYTLQVSTSADFTTAIITRTTTSRLSTGTYYASFPELLFNQRYYVRVKTSLSEEWGRTTTFTRVNPVARLAAEQESGAESLANQVSLYPNPFEDKLTLTGTQSGKLDISVVDNLGRVVYQTISQTGSIETQLQLGTLKAGVYIVKVATEEGKTQVMRVVKK